MASITTIVSPTVAHADQTDSNLFILDVSGSTDSVALWKNLRVSVTSKLSQPFGNPKIGSIPLKRPVDVSVTSVSKNSQNSPIFSIVTNADAKKSYDGDYFSDGASGQRDASLEKLVFEELRKNIEKVLWQARITVTNTETKYTFTLSTFLTNYNERIQINIGF